MTAPILDAHWIAFHRQLASSSRPRGSRAQRAWHALLDRRWPQDPRRRRGPLVRQRGPRSQGDHRGRHAFARDARLRAAVPDGPRRSRFELAERIVSNRARRASTNVFFTNSGSRPWTRALKIAVAVPATERGEATRTRLLGRERGYHGVNFGGTSLGGMIGNRKAFSAPMIPGVDHIAHTHDPVAQRVLARLARARRGARRTIWNA